MASLGRCHDDVNVISITNGYLSHDLYFLAVLEARLVRFSYLSAL